MPSLTVRPFRRDDRDQLTDLERQPGEFITDPWVAERVTLVAEQRRHVVAAAHLLRYRSGPEVGAHHRDSGEIDWLVCRPPASFWPDAEEAADQLMAACLAQFARWNVRVRYADGAVPAPVIHGLPRNWPHIRALYERSGFRHTGDTEVILIARVTDLPALDPRPGVTFERSLGECGTRFTAYVDAHAGGFIEVDTSLSRPERHARAVDLADIGNLHLDPASHGEGLQRLLLARAADWLRLCGTDRLFAYESADDKAAIDLLCSEGFQELTRTDRRWEHHPR